MFASNSGSTSQIVKPHTTLGLAPLVPGGNCRAGTLSPTGRLCMNTIPDRFLPGGAEREANPSRDAGRWTGSLIRTAGLNGIGDDRHRFIIEWRCLRDAHETDENECNHAAPISRSVTAQHRPHPPAPTITAEPVGCRPLLGRAIVIPSAATRPATAPRQHERLVNSPGRAGLCSGRQRTGPLDR